MNERGLDLLSAGQCLLRSALEAAGKPRRQKEEGVTWDHPSLYRIQVASNCILRTLWLNKALLCPTSPYPAVGEGAPTLPHNLSRQVLQNRGQAWLPLGPPQ